MLFIPMMVSFAIVWPFSYFVYKALYVHYFLIVAGVVYGLREVIRATARKRFLVPVRGLVCATAILAAVVNCHGSYRTAEIALERVRDLDLADCNTLTRRLKENGIPKVAVIAEYGLARSMMEYSLSQSGVDVTEEIEIGQPLVTAQRLSLTPVNEIDVVLRSRKGKFALSNTADTSVQAFSPSGVSTEVRQGVVFRWLTSGYDYSAFLFRKYFDGLTAFAKSIPGRPVFYNDFMDSGYYLLVDQLLLEHGLKPSYDPRECMYFVRLNRRIRDGTSKIEDSPVIAKTSPYAGTQRAGEITYVTRGMEQVVWSNDLLELVYIPREGRELAEPSHLNSSGLIQTIRERGLSVANEIGPWEHEWAYLDHRTRSSGVRLADSPEIADSVLTCVPRYVLERESVHERFRQSVFWQSSPEFLGNHGYSVALIARSAWFRLRAELSFPRPIRTILYPFKTNAPLAFRLLRFDRELRLLFEFGPSLEQSQITVRVLRHDGRVAPLFFTLEAPSSIIRIPVDHFALPKEKSVDIFVEPEFHWSKRMMPYDDRLLAYRISSVELVERDTPLYTEQIKRVLRTSLRLRPLPAGEILDCPDAALGTGWFEREVENGSSFRWMADGAEIVLEGKAPHQRFIKIVGQVGPSSPSGEISITASLNGQPFGTEVLRSRPFGRAKVMFDVSTAAFRRAWQNGQNVMALSIEGEGKEIPGDARALDFRVFQVGWADSHSQVSQR
jgi:hypothetical protein